MIRSEPESEFNKSIAMDPSTERAWVEIEADGSPRGTRVWLVIRDDRSGEELRYEIPSVAAVQWHHQNPATAPTATIEIHNVHMRTRALVRTHKTSVDNLLTEIAAARLADDEEKFIYDRGVDQPSQHAMDKRVAQKSPQEEQDDRERLHRLFRDDWQRKKDP